MMRRRNRPSRIQRSERGAVLVIAAVGVVVALISASLAVDLGSIMQEKRLVQKIADLAALDAARDLPNAQSVAELSAARNHNIADSVAVIPGVNPKAVRGVIDPVTKKFVTQAGGGLVQVTATSTVKNFFPLVAGPHTVTATAVAGSSPEAAFSVGSTLAAVDTQKSFLDPMLGKMLGGATALNMSAVSYQGMATGNVTLGLLQTKLLAMGYDVGTPDKLLNTSVKVSDLLTATGQALNAPPSNTTAAAAINSIPIASISNALTLNIGSLVNITQPASDSALETTINAFGLLTGAAEVANGTNFVDVPGITVNVPGVATVGFKLGLIQPAQTARGPVGVQAKTSQVTLRLSINLLPVLFLGPSIALDLDFSAASAIATLTNISCGASPSISIGATTNAAAVGGGATIAVVGNLTASGSLAATAPGSPRLFNYSTDFAPPVGTDPDGQRVGAASLKLSPAMVTITGTGLAAATAAAVQLLIPTILSTVDLVGGPLLQPVLQVLGLDLAAADISALNMYDPPPKCGSPGLIQ